MTIESSGKDEEQKKKKIEKVKMRGVGSREKEKK